MSITYNFDAVFILDSPEALLCFRCRLVCIKGIFQNLCLNYEIGIILIYRSINFIRVQRYKP